MTQSIRLIAALDYAQAGIRVFPCVPGTKRPCFPDNFNKATTDPDVIRGWFETWGDCNVAFVPGQVGLAIVDVDRKKGVDGLDAWLELRGAEDALTPTVLTPTGGLHYHYVGSVRGTHNFLADGIDTRGEGSYALLPPSALLVSAGEDVDGAYEWWVPRSTPYQPLPSRPAAEMAKKTSYARVEAPEGLVLDRPWNIARARLELLWLIDRGYVAGPGNRDVPCFRVACSMLEFGLSNEAAADLIHDIWEPACDGLTENVPDLVEWKIANAAKPGGMQNAIGCRALVEPSVLLERMPGLATAVEANRNARHRFMGRKPSEGAKRPPLQFWDDHRGKRLIPRLPGGCAIVVYGPQGSHKSGVLLRELVDLVIRKGARVLYIAAEGAHGIETARLPALLRAHGLPIEALDENWITADIAPDVLNPNEITDLIACYADFKPDLIVFDTGTRCLGMSDINNTAIGTAAIKAMEAVGRPFDATVFYVTHPGKDTDRGAIGSKQQENQAFGQWLIGHDGDGMISVSVEKMKDGPTHFSVPFRVNREGVPVVAELSTAELARHQRSDQMLHDELREAVWGIVYPLLERGERVYNSDRGTLGLSYIATAMASEPYKLKNTTNEMVKKAILQLVVDEKLKAREGSDAIMFGNAARPPGSLQ